MAAKQLTRAQVRAEERARSVAAMRKFWDSLDSHLDWSTSELTVKQRGDSNGTRKFHADTAREYAEAIFELAKNL